jgi:hypothetical protein
MNTRQYDLEHLRKSYQQTNDPLMRKVIENAGRKIRNETREVKAMREALIKEHRNGNNGNIKDIHDIVAHKRKYQNG